MRTANQELASSEGWCLHRMGTGGNFTKDGVYQWPSAVRQRCGFRMRSTLEARSLLRGRHIVFVGNSVQRRTMYALADLLGGENATRMLWTRMAGGHIFDEHKGYHGFQHVRIDLADGRADAPMQGLEFCGVDPALFECGTVRWGSSPSADEWRSSASLEGWSFMLNASLASTPHAARLARGRVAAVRAALRPYASLALGRSESPMIGPADASAGPQVAGTLLMRVVPRLTCRSPERCSVRRFSRWLEELEAAMRTLGFGEVGIL